MSDPKSVTLVEGALHNPAEARHFMRIKPVNRTVEVWSGDTLLARTTRAVRLIEAGRDLYDPVFYIPREDVAIELNEISKSTHCPLKGDASYYTQSGQSEPPIAWAYNQPFDWAEPLRGRVAFDANQVEFRERPQ